MKRFLQGFIIVLCLLIGMVPASADDLGTLEIHYIDVGQADAAIIKCNDEYMMIDGGNSADSNLIFSYIRNTLNIDHFEYMIATHPHEDHIGGLSGALNACDANVIYSPVNSYDSKAFSSLVKYAGDTGLTYPPIGETIPLSTADVTFLAPLRNYDNTNDQSIVVRIDFGDTSFLFTGDAEWDSEHDMVDSGYDLSADVLKVCHHGSDSSSSYVFLREVMPRYAVISCGEGNSYGHPHDDVLSRLRDAGAQIFRTDLQGTIVCTSDGTNITFETERSASAEELMRPGSGKQANSDRGAGTVVQPAQSNDDTGSAPYIGNKNSKKFHYADCPSVDKMKDSNKVEIYSRDEAINAGYKPCKRCNP